MSSRNKAPAYHDRRERRAKSGVHRPFLVFQEGIASRHSQLPTRGARLLPYQDRCCVDRGDEDQDVLQEKLTPRIDRELSNLAHVVTKKVIAYAQSEQPFSQ